ncbi:MAG: UPF0280 family protein [Desulfovibrio sp.]
MAEDFRSHDRFYREAMRDAAQASGETPFQVMVGETDLYIVARQDLTEEISAFVQTLRAQIQSWIVLQPDFATSLIPIEIPDTAPDIIKHMAKAAELSNVGPMATVAGTIAQAVADEFQQTSPDIIVENGGDNFIHSTKERIIALLSEPQSGARIGVKVPPDEFPVSFCSSSASIGHSLSLGQGELVAVRGKNGAYADAAATRLCNLLHTPDDLQKVITEAERIAEEGGLDGIFAQCGGQIAAWGNLELVVLE